MLLPMNILLRMFEHAIRTPASAGRAIGGERPSRASGAAAMTAVGQPQRTAMMRQARRRLVLARARQAAMSAWAWRLLAIGSRPRHRWSCVDKGWSAVWRCPRPCACSFSLQYRHTFNHLFARHSAGLCPSRVPSKSLILCHAGGQDGCHCVEAGAGEHQRCQWRWSTQHVRCRGASGWSGQRTGPHLAACCRAGSFGLWSGMQVCLLLAACLWLAAACHGLLQAVQSEGWGAASISALQCITAHLQAGWRHAFARCLAGLPAQACQCSYRCSASARCADSCGGGVGIPNGAARRMVDLVHSGVTVSVSQEADRPVAK